MTQLSTAIKTTAAAIVLGLALSGPAAADGGFFGNWYYSDGSQATNGVAGAAPNIIATANGVRCSYMYIVRHGVRERVEVCN